MKLDITKYVPPGMELREEKTLFVIGMVCSIMFSVSFLFRYAVARLNLYRQQGDEWVLKENAVMQDFADLLGQALIGFFILAVCMLGFIVYNYMYHYKDSKSIYLMRRLPDRLERHRRCLSVPVAAALVSIAAAFLLLVIYYGIYMIFTPEQCITPGQWAEIW